MTLELQTYYESRLAMFRSEGWRELIEDVQQMREATNQLQGVTSETLPFKQGELSMMNWLLSLEETSKKAYLEIAQENDDSNVSVDVPSGTRDGASESLRDEDS